VEDILTKAEQFQNLSIKKTNAHYAAAEIFARRHLKLGIPVTVATSVVATSIFATLTQDTKTLWVSLVTGTLSIGAAILSGLQTFLRYSDLSEQHRRAAVAYESIRRSLDLFTLEYKHSDERSAALKRLAEIATKIDLTADAAPTLPDYIYDSVKWRPASHRTYSTPESDLPPAIGKGENR
jgi:hypothetical protein